MNEALIVILAFLWALVLLPGAIRARRSSIDATVGGFTRAMDVLRDGPDGRQVMVPENADRIVDSPADGRASAGGADRRRRDPAVARRRRLFLRLLTVTGVLLPVAVLLGGGAWLLFGVSLVALGGYAVMLRRWKLQRDEAREVVRHFDRGRAREPVPARQPAPRKRAVGESRLVGDHGSGSWESSSAVRVRTWRGDD